jgi:hypothetical protein
MTSSPPDVGHASRLEVLRRMYGEARYRTPEPVWGFDDTDAVGVRVDPTGWVVDVRVSRLDPELREEAGLRAVLVQAYAHAELVRLAAGAQEAGTIDEQAARRGLELLEGRRRIAVRRPARPPHLTRPDGVVTPPPRALETVDRFRMHHGTSRDGEVTVGIRLTNGLAHLDVDQEWLRIASAENLRYALKEAFAAAYEQGDAS